MVVDATPATSSWSSCLNISLSRWRDKQLDALFRSCGLQQESFRTDPETLICCWRPIISDEHKPALLLIHGFATNPKWQWTHQIKPLQEHFRIFAPDLVFFGKSTTASQHRSEVFQARSIAKAMEMMGVAKYSVMGTSYGGFVAYRMAHLFPANVDKVVIANSGVVKTVKDDQELLETSGVNTIPDLLLPQSPAVMRTLLSLTNARPPTYLPTFVLNDLIQYFYKENLPEQIELLKGLKLGQEDPASLPTLSQRVLIVWGDRDKLFPVLLAHRLQKHLGKNADLVIVENTAHCVQLENPQEFNRLVAKFLLDIAV